ncbi:MAG TPA: hypothetical protein VED40_23060 [Azospirillaceae bacterium]|nr:hypothetical protein [Azospirillaceae bacterium]
MTTEAIKASSSTGGGDPLAVLGPDPLRRWIWFTGLWFCLWGALWLALMLDPTHTGPRSPVDWSYYAFWLGITGFFLLNAAINHQVTRPTYVATVSAVKNGLLTPTWAARNTECNGLLAVDEAGRKLCIRGVVHSFDDVKEVSYQGQRLEVAMRRGDAPVSAVRLSTTSDAKTAAHRLANAIGSLHAVERQVLPK